MSKRSLNAKECRDRVIAIYKLPAAFRGSFFIRQPGGHSMTDISPDDRERIYQEEKARREAQKRLDKEEKTQTLQRKKESKPKGCLFWAIGFILLPFAIAFWPITLTLVIIWLIKKYTQLKKSTITVIVFLSFATLGMIKAFQLPDETEDPLTQNVHSTAYPPLYTTDIFDLDQQHQKLLTSLKKGALQIRDPKCPELVYAGLSKDKGSSTDPVFFYTCSDLKNPYTSFNLFVKKSEIDTNQDSGTNIKAPEPVNEATAKSECRKALRNRLTLPSTLKLGLGGFAVYTAPNGMSRVTMDFEAKNKLGNTLPQTAICLINKDGIQELTIKDR